MAELPQILGAALVSTGLTTVAHVIAHRVQLSRLSKDVDALRSEFNEFRNRFISI